MKKSDFQGLLKERGVVTTGYTKPQLEQLWKGAQSLNLEVAASDDHDASLAKRIGDLPPPSSVQYSGDLKQIPDVEFPDILIFLNECMWSAARLKSWRTDDGYRLFAVSAVSGS